jgi:hypothetical protein
MGPFDPVGKLASGGQERAEPERGVDLGGPADPGRPVACVPLHDGIQLCCNRGGLLFGLALARRALALSLAEPSRFEVRLRFENSDLGPKEWPASGDFLLAGSALAPNWWT